LFLIFFFDNILTPQGGFKIGFFQFYMKYKQYLVILGVLCITAFAVIRIFPQYRELVVLFFYMIASNSFIGLPHEPLMIYYGKLYPFYIPVLVSSVPVILGCIIDYKVLTPVLRSRYLSRIRRQRIFRKAIIYFRKFPFGTLVVFAISPIPFWPIRIISIAAKYPLTRYAFATLTGRIPRYVLLCLGGMMLNIPDWVIVVIFVVMFTLPFLPNLIRKTRGLLRSKSDKLNQEEDDPVPLRY